MKKVIIIIVTALSAFLSAQTVNYASHRGSEIAFCATGINSKFFYIEKSSSVGYCCSNVFFLVCRGNDGSEIFRKQVFSMPYAENVALKKTSDNHLLILAGTKYKSCDLGGIRYVAMKIDTTGTVTWNYIATETIQMIIPWTDGGFFIQTNQKFTRYNSFGSSISNFTIDITDIRSAIPHSTGNLLLSYMDQAGPRFRMIDLTGSTVTDLPSVTPFSKMIEDTSGYVYGLGAGILYKCTPTFSFLANTSVSLPAVSSIIDFDYRTDSVFIIGVNTTGQPVYCLLDTNFSVKHSVFSNIKGFQPVSIYYADNNKVNIVGTRDAGFYPSSSFVGYLQTSVLGNLNASMDIGVKRVDRITMWSEPNINEFDRFIYANLDVVVYNYGVDTVRSFHLSHYATTGFCQIGINKLFFHKLPPGDSATVNTGAFHIKRLNTSFGGPPPVYDLCIGTSAPDSTIDVKRENDYLCLQSLNLPVGIEDNFALSYSSVQVIPNPSQSQTKVQCIKPITSYELIDATGRIVQTTLLNEKEFVVEHENVPQGMYFLRLISDGEAVTRKLMISK